MAIGNLRKSADSRSRSSDVFEGNVHKIGQSKILMKSNGPLHCVLCGQFWGQFD